MSPLKDDLDSVVGACAVEVCWRQWRVLAASGPSTGERVATSVIDPEALVLISLAVRHRERRLQDQLLWWAEAGASLMSVQRMRTLLHEYSAEIRQAVGWFASMAVAAGDARWRVLVDGKAATGVGRPGKGPRELRLVDPATLMLRLRSGFGVGAKADLVTFLLGTSTTTNERSAWATAEVLSTASGYSVASVRRAANEMVLARLVEVSADRPAKYSVDAGSWARLLQLHEPTAARRGTSSGAQDESTMPRWRFWAQMFGFLAACLDLDGPTGAARATQVVRASHARDIAERFRRVLAWNGITWIDPGLHPGERYLDAFQALAASVSAWATQNA